MHDQMCRHSAHELVFRSVIKSQRLLTIYTIDGMYCVVFQVVLKLVTPEGEGFESLNWFPMHVHYI